MLNAKYRKILTFLLLFISVGSFSANYYSLARLSSNEGLSQQDVECIVQDKQGFIWIGTYDGLNRFDGTHVIIFRHQPNDNNSISDNRILALAEWKDRDELWIGTDGGGLNCYNLKTGCFKHYYSDESNINSLTDNQIIDLYQSGEYMWASTANGPHRISFDTENHIKIEHFPLLHASGRLDSFQCTLSVTEDINGNTIAGTANGIYVKTPEDICFRKVKELRGSTREVMKDKTGNLWILTEDKLLSYSPDQQKLKNYLHTPFQLNIQSEVPFRRILPVTDRDYLVLSEKQVYWIRVQNNRFDIEPVLFSDNDFFSNNLLKNILLDHSMNVWITSNMDGTARFDLNSKSITCFPLEHPKAVDKIYIQTLIKDRQRRLWIGSSQGLFVHDFKQNKTIRIDRINEDIYDILEDKEHNIWVTSLHHIFYIPKGDINRIMSVRERSDLPFEINDFIGPYSLCADAQNTIWVGMRNGLLQIKKNETQFSYKLKNIQPYKSMGAVNNITKLYFNNERKSLLVGTKNTGLLEAHLNEQGDIEKIETIDSGNERHIWSIIKASNGNIYVGTDSGLRYLDNKNHTLQMMPNDIRLQTYKITGITEDNANNLWMNTSQGLLRYSLSNHQVMLYLNTDGLTTNILCEGILYDPEGFLYIGSIKGINKVDLSALMPNTIEPEFQFVGLRINNTQVLPNQLFNGRPLYNTTLGFLDKLVLKHNENNLTIEFAALHFSNPSKNKFQYQLEGFSQEWTEVDNNIRSATFTNLPSGIYRLKVKSANCDGFWNSTPKVLTIVITPPLWATPIAYLCYITFTLLVFYLIIRYIKERHRTKKQILMEHLEHRKEMEIAEVKLKYHTNITHELRTPLSLISAPVEELIRKSYTDDFLNFRLEIIKNNTDRLLQLINQFLDFRKVINAKYTITIRYENLREILTETRDSFLSMAEHKNIIIEFYDDLEEEMAWFDKDAIQKICSNLLSNALKYTPVKGKISIYATQNQDYSKVSISIEDTGIGIDEKELDKIFDRFYQVPGTLGGTGIGLNLCKQLITLHNGTITVKSRLKEGSIFTIEFPVNREAFPDNIVEHESKQQKEFSKKAPNSVKETEEEVIERKKALILVVEDNHELRSYITSLLKEDKQIEVLVASNGKEGYELAVSHIPNLIISDIMMPVMDGIELIQKSKADMRISHVPIILLTAKVSQENEIEGLYYGADDYIMKPFNPQILKLRVSNLLRLTRKKTHEVASGKEQLNNREKEFLLSFEKYVSENMSSPNFGIEEICRAMSLSRMQLYRKMTAIINKKPSQYIKEIKMKKAYTLMKEQGLNITETMYEVGHTNYTHFSRLFQEVNGISPREVLGMKK